MFIIGGLQKTSLLDFPKKIAAIVFTQGCNFRCGYCHNAELLDFSAEPKVKEEDFFDFLTKRKGKLDGVVITGGEPTVQSGLKEFILKIKDLGFEVKLDTNGTNPKVLSELLQIIDYVAMDIKAPFTKYGMIAGVNVNIENIRESINLIMSSNVDYEFRTTVVKSQLEFCDFEEIGKQINGAKKYYLQKFVPSKIYDKTLLAQTTYTDEEFKLICDNLKKYVEFVDFR